MRIKVVGTICVLSMGAVWATLAGAQVSRSTPDWVPTGKGYGQPSNGATAKAGSSCTNGICYHGGPVMLATPNLYYIWYGNWTSNSATSILPAFAKSLGGSGYEKINSTYYCKSTGCNGSVTGNASLAGQVNDNYSQGTALSDSAVEAVVAAHAGHDLPMDTDGIYFVLTSADVNETSGFCTSYCGWHTHGTISGQDVKYSFVGNPDRCPSACEAETNSPNGNSGADGMASIIAHESEEAISDPDLNAWYDRRGAENADKCAWTFGCSLPGFSGSSACAQTSTGAYYNIVLGGNDYLIQQNWENAGGGFCTMTLK